MKYKITIQRMYDTYFEVDADNEDEALEKANEQFDELQIRGNEMYINNEEVEEL